MAQVANIKQVADYFKTGEIERDKLANFRKEWELLSDAEKAWFKEAVGDAIA